MYGIKICFIIILLVFEANAQIQLWNDEFKHSESIAAWSDINATESWGINQLKVLNVNDSVPGKLIMIPHTVSWYEEYRGPLVYKNIGGNFVVTTSITAQNRNRDNIPNSDYSLAGIMLRRPVNYPNGALGPGGWQAGQQDYIFISLGYAALNHPSCSGCPGPHFEIKNTNNSVSTLEVQSIDTTEVEIRIVRKDSSIIILTRFPDEAFELRRKFTRTDFTDSLQIGFVGYTDWDKVYSYTPAFHNTHEITESLMPDPSPGIPFNPDLYACFDFIRFDSLQIPLELQNLDLATQVSNMDLESNWGYPTQEFCPPNLHVYQDLVNFPFVHIQASDQLTASHNVQNSHILYHAMESIDFQTGFELSLNSQMEVMITACSN